MSKNNKDWFKRQDNLDRAVKTITRMKYELKTLLADLEAVEYRLKFNKDPDDKK